MKAYVILKGGKFDTLMFDADKVINYFNENKDSDLILEVKTFEVPKEVKDDAHPTTPSINIPAVPYRDLVCKNWEDCTNPFRDCIYCPVKYTGTFSSPITKEFEHFGQSVLNDTVKITCTNDC